MYFVVGGAYQGKLDIAKERYSLTEQNCFDCKDQTEIDFSKKLLYNFEEFILYLAEKDIPAARFIAENKEKLEDKVIVMTDPTCGVVPMDKTARKWREECGRAGVKLSQTAEEVIRVFCGIATKIK